VKRKRIITASVCVLLVLALFAGISYHNFHDPDALIEHSPANRKWAIDFKASGFTDAGMSFRAHDFIANPLKPRYICDLYWRDRYDASQLKWSRDGSVAAVTVRFSKGNLLFACYYDFREHRASHTGSGGGSPLEPSPHFSAAVEKLMAERGGVGKVVSTPDATKSAFWPTERNKSP
jgi:hypothetical protein